jgi:hypothetical protein
MGDRFIDKCSCGEELYFANWTNYTDRCAKCGKFYVCEMQTREILEAEYDVLWRKIWVFQRAGGRYMPIKKDVKP